MAGEKRLGIQECADEICRRSKAQQNTPAAQSRSVGHPGFAESLIPVWGSGREAVADFQEGDYVGAALNGALAASDVFLAASLAKGLAKGGVYIAKNAAKKKAPYDWDDYVRPWMGKRGHLLPRQPGHHWLIPQNGWGKDVPDWFKNQPWNIKGMPDQTVHNQVHGHYRKPPSKPSAKARPRAFSPAERYWYGTPDWAKVGTAAAAGHPAAAIKSRSED